MGHKQVLWREGTSWISAPAARFIRVKGGLCAQLFAAAQAGCRSDHQQRQTDRVRARGFGQARSEGTPRTADAQAEQLRSLTLKFERKIGEAGVLYGSVTSMDVAHALKEQGYEIDRRRIVMREPFKRLEITRFRCVCIATLGPSCR